MVASKSTSIIRMFREILGDQTGTGYTLNVDSLSVPNSLNTGKFNLPEIILRPFVIESKVGDDEYTIGDVRFYAEYFRSRFQVDIYAATLADLIKIRDAVADRIFDYTKIELMGYSADWERIEGPPVLYSTIPLGDKISLVQEGCQELVEAETQAELIPGTWYSDEEAFYVCPVENILNIQLFEIFNGRIFSNGHTAYRDGIRSIRQIMARKVRDKEPDAERYITDYLISYQRTRVLNQGEIIEEEDVNINVTES